MSKLIKILFEMIKMLNFTELLQLKNLLFHAAELSDSQFKSSIELYAFSDKKQHCPRCSSIAIVKYGLNALKNQRFRCNDCGRCFCNRTNTPMSYSKKSMESWYTYLQLMTKTATIRECAAALKINIATAFQWRHKVLNSIMPLLPNKLEGIVEIEEIAFNESFKGNHSISKNFELKRPSIKRKLTSTQQLYSKKIFVLCCKDRSEGAFATVSDRCKTRLSHMLSILGDKITKGSTLCTNNNLSYIPLANKLYCKLYKMRDNHDIRDGKYHIQTASGFGKIIKNTINEKFKGVATRYLNFYLAWLQWLETAKNKKSVVQLMDILSMCVFSNTKLRVYDFRSIVPLNYIA